MTVFIFLALILILSLILAFYNRRFSGGICKKCFKKELKQIAMLCDTIDSLDDCSCTLENEKATAILKENRNRLFDAAFSVVRECSDSKLIITAEEWRGIFDLCINHLRSENGKFDSQSFNRKLKILIDQNPDFTMYQLYALPLALRMAILLLLCQNARQVLKKQRLIKRLRHVCASGRESSVFDELARQPEQIYNLLALGSDETDYSGCINKALMSYGLPKETLCSSCLQDNLMLNISTNNLFASLITMRIDIDGISQETSENERLLSAQTDGYGASDKATKTLYKRELYRFCRASETQEKYALLKLFMLCGRNEGIKSEAGYYLLMDGQREYKKLLECRMRTNRRQKRVNSLFFWLIYALFCVVFMQIFMMLLAQAPAWLAILSGVLLLPCAFFMAKMPADMIILSLTENPEIPRLENRYAQAPENKTVLVVPCLLSSLEKCERLLKKIELCRLSSPDYCYALLGDFPPSDKQEENQKLILQRLERGIEQLNTKYDGGFACLVRENIRFEGKYMPLERKRGAIKQLCSLLKENNNSFILSTGCEHIEGSKYVLTIDEDTVLAPGAMTTLICSIAHPLNAAGGFGRTLQPDVVAGLPDAKQTYFARAYLSGRLLASYPSVFGDTAARLALYSPFGGKGIFDAEAYLKTSYKVPQNKILSHDQPEGDLLNCLLCSSAEAAETVPQNPQEYLQREHRWIRGDWQNMIFLAGRKNFSVMFSLCSIFNCLASVKELNLIIVLLLLCGFAPAVFPSGILIGIIFLGLPLVLTSIKRIFSLLGLTDEVCDVYDAMHEISDRFISMCVGLLLLPCKAAISFDAALKALFRSIFTKKNLLQWSEVSEKNLSAVQYFSLMWAAPFFGLTVLLLCISAMQSIPLGCIILALYGFAPIIYYNMAQTKAEKRFFLSAKEKQSLYILTARTLRFFADGMAENNHYLPPDNYQQEPFKGFCERTSITNIGFGVLSVACGFKMGMLPRAYVIELLEHSVSTIESLQKFSGCHYNWYNAGSLEPMGGFISAVDSGNFSACLLTAAEMLRRTADKKDIDDETGKKLSALLEGCDQGGSYKHICSSLEQMNGDGVYDWLKEFKYNKDELNINSAAVERILEKWGDAENAGAQDKAEKIAARLERTAREENLAFLYNNDKKLFYTGFDSNRGKYTESCYDLFASENLLCSYFAISTGMVPPEHWYALSRKTVRLSSGNVLLSWSGTMFETLMPLIFLKTHGDTALGISSREVVNRNIITGQALQTPFGVSESCCADINSNGDYSYTAFGLPCLALDTKQARPIFAPYASVLGIELFTPQVYKNIAQFTSVGMSDIYGMFESLDCRYVPARSVKCYMSHHQGMIVAALCNLLENSAVRSAFMGCADMNACKLLLYQDMPAGEEPIKSKMSITIPQTPVLTANVSAARLSLGNMALDIKRDGFSLIRERVTVIPCAKALFERSGRIYISDGIQCYPVFWDNINAGFTRAVCCGEAGGIGVCCEATALMDGNSYLMHFTLRLNGSKNAVKLLFESDLCLAPKQQYNAHPQYNNLFIKCRIHDDCAVASTCRYNSELSCTAGIRCSDISADYYISRADFCGRGNIYIADPVKGEQYEVPTEPMLGFTADVPYGAAQWECSVIITCGYSAETVKNALTGASFSQMPEYRLIAAEMARGFIKRGHLSDYEQTMLLKLSDALLCGTDQDMSPDFGMDILYRLGISGTNKIVTIKTGNADSLSRLKAMLKCTGIFAAAEETDVLIYPPEELLSKELFSAELEDCVKAYRACNTGKIAIIRDNQAQYCAVSDAVISLEESVSVSKPVKLELKPCGNFPASDLSYMPQGFCNDGFAVSGITPRPWCNILSNGSIGAVIAENGAGNTFGENANITRFTRPAVDWVRNVPSEIVYLRDRLTGETWSITSSPINRGDEHLVMHGFGYSEFFYNGFDIEASQSVFIDTAKPQKHYLIKLYNNSGRERRITVGFYADAFIGQSYNLDKRYCMYSAENDCAYCKHGDKKLYLSGGMAYGVCSEAFIGPQMNLCAPLLETRAAGRPDCLCAVNELSIAAHEKATVCFSIGESVQDGTDKQEELYRVKAFYSDIQDRIQFNTGNRDFDMMLSKWLPYQTLNSRFLARCGYYQAGGAVGFRDQLQDCLCLMYYNKELVRGHIVECAQHQYVHGDVQHWWHSKTLGVRTRITDDRLWLPYVACKFAEFCDDYSIFDVSAHFLDGPELTGESYYGDAVISSQKAPLYEHCKKAIEVSMTMGAHGFPLMGGGDWNDAMDEAGINGEGESVWLGWFFLAVADSFESVASKRGDTDFVLKLTQYSRELLEALEGAAWDGDRYIRAITDEGEVLGSRKSTACKIDAISQAWAVLSGFADSDRCVIAIKEAYQQLHDKKLKLIRLLTPAFSVKTEQAGYINDYPEGIRENGGQYTHGAIWLAKAFAVMGMGDEAWEIIKTVSPLFRSEEEKNKYGNEPYVLSADIYRDGRGGWSWYTGAAGWYFTTMLEDIFGIKIKGERLTINPCFPTSIGNAELTLNFNGSKYIVRYHNPLARSGANTRITVDGQSCDGTVLLKDDGLEHRISVIV